MKKYSVFVTEPIPEIDFGLKTLKGAKVRIKDKFVENVSSKDLHDVDAVIAVDSKITRESLRGANKLKVIGRFGAGVDSVDIQACTEKGIIFFNSPGLNAQSVAEHIIGMMIAISKKFWVLDNLVKSGNWADKHEYMGNELFKKTLGIIGLGNVGSRLAKMAQAFGMNILSYDPYVKSERANKINVKLVDLELLLKNSDYVSINAPLTNETENLISERELRLMKNNAILINTARGGLVDEQALHKAIKNSWIAGASIDVLKNEPVSDHFLFRHENVVFSPHTSSWTVEAFRRITIAVCENILKVMDGKIPDNVVNTEVLESIKK